MRNSLAQAAVVIKQPPFIFEFTDGMMGSPANYGV
jgi:hypothetical protein